MHIGFALDGPSDTGDAALEIFRSELKILLDRDFNVIFSEDLTLVGDHTLQTASQNVQRLIVDPHADLIITLGPLTSVSVAQRSVLEKPVVAAFMPEPELSGAPLQNGASGVSNLNYLTVPAAFARELDAFREIVSFRKMGFLAGEGLLNALPSAKDFVLSKVEHLGVEIVPVPVGATASETLSSISSEVDAVYIAYLGELSASEVMSLFTGFEKRGLPSFSRRGRFDVERGALASLTPGDWLRRLARRTALNTQDILLGGNAATLPVAITRRDELLLNLATARAIDVRPSFRILTEATVLHEGPAPAGRELSLSKVLAEAVTANRDLARKEFEVQAGKEKVAQARSGLLPQLNLSATGNVIDQDRASVVISPERSLTGSLRLTQTLWSDQKWANLSIQRYLQVGRQFDQERVQLDVALEAATAYLAVLRTETAVAILRSNLQISRMNLELAEVRVLTGVIDRSEVYRWKSQIASDKSAIINARAERDNLKAELNRLLNRPVTDEFSTEEAALTDPALPHDPRGQRFLRDPWTFARFREFMIKVALEASPELAQLDATIGAQQRRVRSAKRSFYLPDISLSAQGEHRAIEGGVGTDTADNPFDIDRTDWAVGITASIPLFTSGSRSAEVRKTEAELRELETAREALSERIEQRVFTTLNLTAASRSTIELAEEAAQAARDNLALVTDGYARGTRSIVSLLDAQNAAVAAELATADATFSFMIDLMEVERAVGRFSFFVRPEEREAWFRAAEEFIEDKSRGRR